MNLHFNIDKYLITPIILVTGGCASVMMGSYQDIYIETKCGTKPVNAECSVANEIGEWSIKTPGSLKIHKGFDELELTCKGNAFESHELKIKSYTNLPLYGNALIGGGIGVVADVETKAGFDYPTKISFIVNSCINLKNTNDSKKSKNDKQIEKILESKDSKETTTNEKILINQAKLNDSKIQSKDEKDNLLNINSEFDDSTKIKKNQYCKQVDSNIPGCVFQ